jgi:hypothetical protein
MRSFVWKKYELGGRLKVTIHILLYGDKLWTAALMWSLVWWKIVDIPGSFICVIVFAEAFKDRAKFWGCVGTYAETQIGNLALKKLNFKR